MTFREERQQGQSKLLLQLRDQTAYSLLGYEQFPCGIGKIQSFCKRAKNLQFEFIQHGREPLSLSQAGIKARFPTQSAHIRGTPYVISIK